MASGSSRAREGGEGSTHCTVPQHQPDPDRLGCDPTGCGGGTARSWPERGRLGDAEAVTHRSQFRKGNFQPKQHLEHLAEKLKLLDLEGGREEKEHLCSWRKRTIAFRGDAKASGSSHEGPRAHGSPTTADVEESAQEDREQIHSDLEKLKKQREEILELKISGERRCQDYLTQTEVERQKIVSEFRQLRRFLKDQELVLLAQLGELDREMMRRQEEEETKITGEISLLDVLICKMQKKLEQPASRFLQDARRTVDRGKMGSAQRTTETFSDLEQRLHVISQQNSVLREMLGRFQDVLLSELEKEQGPSIGGDGKAFVTLDPDTANTRLILSRDRRGVRWTDAGQDLPTTPQRFDASCCVLGCQGFTVGRHCWEVEVARGRTWALGVARRSVPRKGWLEFQPEKGIWAMGRCGNRYRVFTSPITTFPTTGETGRVRVALDYGEGQVTFYLAEHEPPIFTFHKASFGGESVFPFFWVGRGSHLRLCP
ncbi:E3 ubiquitin-protein ligase TRIM7-like [Accipiter gentilis]|uniref:E3 ubiquitin-protein ligase TRIM7-like n=1 Tax=Astur gentilis TaxID=8957 RepID=UPI002110D2B3|nr:E3 ubiquitin-protein ligase TRIM7-like [Accipiter gentilis]